VEGKVTEIAGEIIDNQRFVGKGKAEKIAGKVQEKIGKAEVFLGSRKVIGTILKRRKKWKIFWK